MLCAAAILASSACAGARPAAGEGKEESQEESVLVGAVTREEVEAANTSWVEAGIEAHADAGASQALASVEPGAELTVYLGTWCDDSRREVPRFWKALDAAGGLVPFTIHYVGVDREKKEPAAAVQEGGVLYLPTFVVRRGGHEVGRVVETSPNGIEKDVLALLTGKAQGVIATRDDLPPTGAAQPPL